MNEAACWRAVESRDAASSGRFFYGVLTTGVFCRPGCSSRTPRRENVRFFATVAEAEALGYRACRRCRPDQAESAAAAKITALRERIEAGEERSLEGWSREFGWSPAHLQKAFKAVTGYSPARYARQMKLARLKNSLRETPTVTQAMNDAGYGSTSRLHQDAVRGLGMSPAEYKRGARGLTLHYAFVESPVGPAAIAWT
jgi:AraC family transcriptional regulator of adaptative response/methylated-DNA-[protein]-cysteine methyltransferase